MGTIKAYYFTDDFDFEKIKQSATEMFRAKILKDAIIIEKEEKVGFLFRYGVAVFWDFEDEMHVLQKMTSLASKLKIAEAYGYEISDAQPIKIISDLIFIDSDDELKKLSVSYAIAQSIKLEAFESSVKTTLLECEHIPLDLARLGRVKMPRREIAKQRGRLFIAKSNIYLHFELLDTPEFFWEYPELEVYYQNTRKYLELQPRIEIVNKKMQVIGEMLEILADEQNHKHSALLEWIIIALIAFEIVSVYF